MKVFTSTTLLCLFAILGSFSTSLAQTEPSDSTLYLVVKTDGTEYYGYILSDDGREIELNTKSIGRIFITKSDIEKITPVDDKEIGEDGSIQYRDYRNEGPFTTRYFLTTNAHPIEKGQNYALIHPYGPEVHFAVTDQFSLGIMASWIASPIGIAAKYAFPTEGNTKFALGTIMASSGYLARAQAYGGLHWATVTRGDRSANISFSMGYAYADLHRIFYLGERYEWNTYSSEYRIPSDAEDDLEDLFYGDDFDEAERSLYKPLSGSVVTGISGIAPVGKKASFIVDAIAFFGTSHEVRYTDYPITRFIEIF